MPGPAPRKAAMRKGHWRSHGSGSKVKMCRGFDAPGSPPEEPRLGACRKTRGARGWYYAGCGRARYGYMTDRPISITGTSAQESTLRGALYMVAAAVFFSVMIASIRHISAQVHAFEVVFFRNLFGFIVIVPILVRGGGLRFLHTDSGNLKLYAIRGGLAVTSMLMWFYAIGVTPLAEAVSLSFTAPLFTVVAAIIFLGEKAGPRRWLGTFVGFAGAMLVLRPGFDEVTLAQVLLLASSALVAASLLIIKVLARTEPSERIVAYMIIVLAPLSLVPALFVWEWPNLAQLFWLAVIGTAGTMGHVMLTRSLSVADVTAVMPYDFLRLPFVAFIAFIAFEEVPDTWAWLGGATIFASTFYVARREAKAAAREGAPRASIKPVAATVEARSEPAGPQA